MLVILLMRRWLKLTEELEYLDSDTERAAIVTTASVETDEFGNISESIIPARTDGTFAIQDTQSVQYVDIVASQQAGVGMALIPFINHDDAKRALTGSNQQRQAVPLIKPECSLVGTGLESKIIGDIEEGFKSYSF